jgi:Ca-activated chloride channel family protein
MAGDKIVHARMAAASLLESLTMGDIVSIYTFSDRVAEIAPPTVAAPDVMSSLIASTQQIMATGSTNMYDGLRVAEAQVAKAPGTHPVRRVIVISDGQANVGPSSPEELGQLAARGTEAGVQVSAIGVGLDYDERTLGALAVQSSGRLYHLEQPSQMASILDQEVRLLSQTVATDAYLEVIPAPGVEIIGAEFVKGKRHGSTLRVGLGALYGSQHREVLIRVKVNAAELSKQPLATARFIYRDRADGLRYRQQDVLLVGSVSTDAKAASASANPRVKAMVARHEAALAQIKAAEMLNAGQTQQAAEILDRSSAELHAVAAASPSAPDRERLVQQAEQVKRTSESAKKADTQQKARQTALDSYGYAFSDEGLAPPPSVKPPAPRK